MFKTGVDGAKPSDGRLYGLLALNAAVLLVLGAIVLAPKAVAQLRPHGDYVMVSGNVKGAAGGAVYVVDTFNQELIAITYDPNTQKLSGIGYRSLARDAADVVRGTPR